MWEGDASEMARVLTIVCCDGSAPSCKTSLGVVSEARGPGSDDSLTRFRARNFSRCVENKPLNESTSSEACSCSAIASGTFRKERGLERRTRIDFGEESVRF